jgi:broad-specificity NMP kinase
MTTAQTLAIQDCERCGAVGVAAHAAARDVVLSCPTCGHEETRRRLPFFSVTGASGSGKSTICRRLWHLLPECVTLDGDLLWSPALWKTPDAFYERWLIVAAQIAQSGRPVVVCTAAMPGAWEDTPWRVFFTDVHVLALVCDDDALLRRLAERNRRADAEAPADFLDQTLTFNRWLREHVQASVDTDRTSPEEAATQVAAWVRERL